MATRNLLDLKTRTHDRLDLIAWDGWEDPYRLEQVVRANLAYFAEAGVPMVLPAGVALSLPMLTREELLPVVTPAEIFAPWSRA